MTIQQCPEKVFEPRGPQLFVVCRVNLLDPAG